MRAVIGTAAILVAACLEYSPHVLPSEERHRDVNRKNIARLLDAPSPGPLRFAVLGDTQTAFDETERAVESLSRHGDVAFVVQIGDLTELGLTPEYEAMNDLLRGLPVPYVVVIGNHDHLGNGEDLYERMFGPQDFAFTWARTRFVFLDTCSREEEFDGTVPDLATLAVNLAPSPDHDRAFVFSHVKPESADFDTRLRDGFRALLRDGGALASFHGHEHRYESYVQDGVPYFVAAHANDREYLLVSERDDGGFAVERVTF